MKYVLAFLCLVVCGCATTTQLPDHDGKKCFYIECPGLAQSMSSCISKANEICNGKYKIIGATQNNGAPVAMFNQSGTANMSSAQSNAYGFSGSSPERSLSVQCE